MEHNSQKIPPSDIVQSKNKEFPGFNSSVSLTETPSDKTVSIASEIYSRYVYPNGPYDEIQIEDETIILSTDGSALSSKVKNGVCELASKFEYLLTSSNDSHTELIFNPVENV